ncbi:unnamed protein product [Arabidopsis thaliana]|uniref:Uncharacterized protein n=1 Tax=Arabidopsis thaliana TaxID=3702 RepID=A0A654G4U5_ARATH|nr:unnamed protein product [Arabidopsis thaliana]
MVVVPREPSLRSAQVVGIEMLRDPRRSLPSPELFDCHVGTGDEDGGGRVIPKPNPDVALLLWA